MDNAKGPFLLHVEGVNLSQVLDDTQNINVIRGASMALRDAARDVGDWLTGDDGLCPNAETIQTGASAGVFLLPVGQQAAQDCRDAIVKRLNAADFPYRHFTFAVAIQRLTDFALDRERLLAKIRFKQLQQGSLAPPGPNDSTSLTPCPVDGVRPAATHAALKGKQEMVSASVASRLQYGRANKKRFFEEETGDPLRAEMTWDLSEIALESPYPQLNGKLAYFYADGNSFGGVVKNAIGTSDALTTQQQWDRHIQQKRRTFLSQLVRSGLHQRGLCEDFTTPDGRLRMEVLLWGGDELLLVVPAWLGFHTANAFFQQSSTWDFAGQALTHAGGLVFCHHKTPVHRVRHLAKDLAERVKEDFSRKENLYDYMVLESIDFPTEALDSFFARHYKTLAGCRQPLAPVDWDNLSKHWPDALFCLPKSQVYAIAHAAIGQGQAAFDKQCRRLKTLVGQATMTRAESELGSLFKQDFCFMWRWVRLAELWDYLAPERMVEPVGQPLAGSQRQE